MFKTIPAVSLGSSRRCARDEFSLSSFSALAEDELKLLVSCQTDKHSYTFSLPLHDDSFLKLLQGPVLCVSSLQACSCFRNMSQVLITGCRSHVLW